MTNEEIIKLAREAGAVEPESLFGRTDYVVMTKSELERFANLAYERGVDHTLDLVERVKQRTLSRHLDKEKA